MSHVEVIALISHTSFSRYNTLLLVFLFLFNKITAWILGLFMCKTVSYLQGVAVSASINTLVAVSADRYVRFGAQSLIPHNHYPLLDLLLSLVCI